MKRQYVLSEVWPHPGWCRPAVCRFLLAAPVVICLVFATSNLYGDYDAYCPPSATVISQTQATTPANRTRTTIGIGELVNLWIEQWSDQDWDNGLQQIVYDTIGTCTWVASGDGGSVSPTTGTSTVLTASSTPNGVTVTATVDDSPLGDDAPIQPGKSFSVIAPNGGTYALKSNNPWPAGNNTIGARCTLQYTVQPTSVSFYNASFHEYIPNQYDYWPDESLWQSPISGGAYGVNQANQVDDNCDTGLLTKERLNNQGQYEDADFYFYMFERYLNASSQWVKYHDTDCDDDHNAADFKSRLANDGVWCAFMGPFE